jgi:CRP-like cAMP-binding protein
MSIANYLELKRYRLGEIILKKGDPPRYFYILTKGRAKLIQEEIIVRDK